MEVPHHWRKERVSTRTLGPEGVDCEIPHWLGRGNSKVKTQIGQYLLAGGLGRYRWYQSQTQGNVPERRLFSEGRHEAVCQQGR